MLILILKTVMGIFLGARKAVIIAWDSLFIPKYCRLVGWANLIRFYYNI